MPGSPSTFPEPLTTPPSWLSLLKPGGEAEGDAPVDDNGPLPGEGWPRLESIDYVNKLILLIVLLLALPWLIGRLLTHPAQVPRQLGEHLLGTPAAGA